MIGIIDYDFLMGTTNKKVGIPCLEAMKIAAYYEKEENKKCYLISNLEELDVYEKIYFFSNLRPEEIPKTMLLNEKIVCHGKYFHGGNYSPLEPILAEYMIPKTGIYKRFLRERFDNKQIGEKAILDFLESSYCRLYAGEEKLALPPIHPRKKCYIYDDNFLKYPTWREDIKEILKHKPSSIVSLSPLYCKTVTSFLDMWLEKKIAKTNIVYWDFFVPNTQTNIFLEKYRMGMLRTMTLDQNVYLLLGKNYVNNVYDTGFYVRNLIQVLDFLYALWAKNIPLKLEYFPPPIGCSNPFEELFEAVAKWSRRNRKLDQPAQDILLRNKKIREQYEKIILRQPKIAELLSVSRLNLEKKGYWDL